MTTSIPITDAQWRKLLALKINPSDTFSDVLDRILKIDEKEVKRNGNIK